MTSVGELGMLVLEQGLGLGRSEGCTAMLVQMNMDDDDDD